MAYFTQNNIGSVIISTTHKVAAEHGLNGLEMSGIITTLYILNGAKARRSGNFLILVGNYYITE